MEWDTPQGPNSPAPQPRAPVWHAFVINMRDAVTRYAFVAEQLKQAGIAFTRIEAVDGRDLVFPVQGVSKWSYRLLHGRELRGAEVGCYLSHLKAIDAFLATDLPYVLILEDDVRLADNLSSMIDAAILQHDDWDVLRLSTVNSGKRFIVSENGACKLGVCFTREKGAGGYMLSRHAAKVFRQRLTPMRLAYDIAFDLEYLMGLKALGVDPLPIEQNIGFATQIQTDIRKLPAWRYLTVFPFRAWLEISRVVCRAMLYARLRLKHSLRRKTFARP